MIAMADIVLSTGSQCCFIAYCDIREYNAYLVRVCVCPVRVCVSPHRTCPSRPYTLNPKPKPLNPKPLTLNPEP
jgi:hypothetical protein